MLPINNIIIIIIRFWTLGQVRHIFYLVYSSQEPYKGGHHCYFYFADEETEA